MTETIKMIIAEDHELTRMGLKMALEKYNDIEFIAETDNGQEIVSLANELKPNFIIMDIGLVDGNGIDATKEIKAKHSNIKVMMLTSHENENEVLACISSGADGYCLKETPPEQLYTAIKSIADGNAWLSKKVAEKIFKQLYGQTSADLKANTENTGVEDFIDNDNPNPHYPLTDREFEILKNIVEGKSNQEIADTLYISVPTVKTHVKGILNKLCVDDRVQAVVKAVKKGIIKI